MRTNLGIRAILLASFGWTVALVWTVAAQQGAPSPMTQPAAQSPLVSPIKAAMQTSDEAKAASAGCITCHTSTDEATMHPSGTVTL